MNGFYLVGIILLIWLGISALMLWYSIRQAKRHEAKKIERKAQYTQAAYNRHRAAIAEPIPYIPDKPSLIGYDVKEEK